MKILSVLLMMLLMNGCMYQRTDITDIKKAIQFCKNKGGVKHIEVWFDTGERVVCSTGAEIALREVELSTEVAHSDGQ